MQIVKKEILMVKARKYLYITVAVILGIYALTMLIPLYFVVINSLKRPSQFYDNPWTLPKVLYLANYRKVFSLTKQNLIVVYSGL